VFQLVWEVTKFLANELYTLAMGTDEAKTAMGWLGKAGTLVGEGFDWVSQRANALWTNLKNIASWIEGGFILAFNSVTTGIKNFMLNNETLMGGLKSVASFVSDKWEKVIGVLRRAHDWIQKVAGGPLSKIKGALSFFGFGGAETVPGGGGGLTPAFAGAGAGARTAPVPGSPGGQSLASKGIGEEFLGGKTAAATPPKVSVTANVPGGGGGQTDVSVKVQIDGDDLASYMSKKARHSANKSGKQTSSVAAESSSQQGYGED